MYTGLRGWIEVKEEHWFADGKVDWESMIGIIGPKTDEYANKPRSSFIPNGAVFYMEDDWVDRHKSSLEEGILSFTCSLKNYDGEIDSFIEALPELATRWQLEERYEEDMFSKFHVKGVEDEQ